MDLRRTWIHYVLGHSVSATNRADMRGRCHLAQRALIIQPDLGCKLEFRLMERCCGQGTIVSYQESFEKFLSCSTIWTKSERLCTTSGCSLLDLTTLMVLLERSLIDHNAIATPSH